MRIVAYRARGLDLEQEKDIDHVCNVCVGISVSHMRV